MDIDDESLAMRDTDGDFDPTRDTTVRVTSRSVYMTITMYLKNQKSIFKNIV